MTATDGVIYENTTDGMITRTVMMIAVVMFVTISFDTGEGDSDADKNAYSVATIVRTSGV